MRPLKKPRRPEREEIGSSRKKASKKYWQLEYKDGGKWKMHYWGKYLSLEHALKMLQKDFRSYSWQHLSGRNKSWRIINVQTQEIREILYTEKGIFLK